MTTSGTHQTRLYKLSSAGENGYIEDSYTTAPITAFGWVMDPACGAVKISPFANTIGKTDGWKASDRWHAAISFRAYCKGYAINAATLTTALKEINRQADPESPLKPLLSVEQAGYITDRMTTYTDVARSGISADLTAFTTKVGAAWALLVLAASAARVSRAPSGTKGLGRSRMGMSSGWFAGRGPVLQG